MSQKNSAIMANAMPETQMWQQKVTDARKRGDMYDAARYTMEMTKFQKESGINPLKSMAPIFVQFPFFMGMFFGLTLLVSNLQSILEIILLYLLLFWEKRSMRSLIR